MSKRVNVAVVGATGTVGESLLSLLVERDFPYNDVHAIASRRSAGSKIAFNGDELTVEDLEKFDFNGG